MTKVVIEIKDKKDSMDSCNVKITTSGYEKGTKAEQTMTAVIYNAVNETIKNLQKIG